MSPPSDSEIGPAAPRPTAEAQPETLPALEPIPEPQQEATQAEADYSGPRGTLSVRARPLVDLTRATEVTPQVSEAIQDMFEHHHWNSAQQVDGAIVREAVEEVAAVIIHRVPPSADRSSGFRKLREALMACNSAITHGGKY